MRQLWIAAGLSLAACAGTAFAQMQGHAIGQNLGDITFAPTPGLPHCARNAVLSGDPAKGPSIILGKIAAGCTVPWHWHTPNEHLMLVSGRARIEPRDAKPFVLEAGGFAKMPSRHVHQFSCLNDCMMYVQSDGPFDIHFVDAPPMGMRH
jgi:quercetin dioxygenase-like cupin family protein